MITLDKVTPSVSISGTSQTTSHTCSGSNRVLFVAINLDSAPPGLGDVLTGVTYGGVAMTLIAKKNTNNTTYTNNWAYLYYLIAPATGANNVVITTSTTINIRSSIVSYNGALQTSQPDASITNGVAAATSITTALTTIADNCWMVSLAVGVLQIPVASTGVTSRNNTENSRFGDSNGNITPPGSYSMTWTNGGTDSFNIIQASFSPAPGGGLFFGADI